MLIGNQYRKGCLLIALDQLFPYEDWGKEFLEDFYTELGSIGINTEHLPLVEECADIKVLRPIDATSSFQQGDVYWELKVWDTKTRYRLPYHRHVVIIYVTCNGNGHAVCIPANIVNCFLEKYTIAAFILPKHGLIIDRC